MNRFFDTPEEYFSAVLNGDQIETGCGYTDGDHVTWLISQLGTDELDLISLAYEFSQRVTTVEEAKNVSAYMKKLFDGIFVFNMLEASDSISDEEMEKIYEEF